MSVETELMPCPFCGGDVNTAEEDGGWYVFCYDCDLSFGRDECGGIYRTKEFAIDAWNNRVIEEEHGRLKAFVDMIGTLNNCNNCAISKDCCVRPGWAKHVRYNCAMWGGTRPPASEEN